MRSGRAGDHDGAVDGASTGAGAPGKVSRTAQLQRRARAAAAPTQAAASRPLQLLQAVGDPFGLHLGDPHEIADQGLVGAGGELPHLATIAASFGPAHDLSDVRAHVGGATAEAADRLGASAYAMDGRVGFAGTPDLHTAAHEAAHVVQQRGGVQLAGGMDQAGDPYERHADAVADRVVAGRDASDLLAQYAHGTGAGTTPVVQRRRLPANLASLLQDPADPTRQAPNFDASAAGTLRLLERAAEDLSPADLHTIRTSLLSGGLGALLTMPPSELLVRLADEVRAVRPDLVLGDPALIDAAPSRGSADEANLHRLVVNARRIFDAIIGGGHDADLGQVFGSGHVTAAKRKYRQGRRWMERLERRRHVVTDRSGYSGEVSLGGLTGFHSQIALEPSAIDNPDAHESIIVLIHEAMHAGNADVDDFGYIDREDEFVALAEAVKLNNAAHYEVVPRRILGAAFDYAGRTFVPAGTTVGGVTAPPLSDSEQTIRQTSETFREAWTIGLNLHTTFLDAYREPRAWTRNRGGGRSWARALPFWSKVEKLTIHEKTDIDPNSADVARHPVSQIDMALSEGLVRRLATAMGTVPTDEAGMIALEDAHLDAAARTAARASVAARKASLIRLVLQQPGVGPITGPVDRDVRVVETFVTLDWGTVLDHRDVSAFPD